MMNKQQRGICTLYRKNGYRLVESDIPFALKMKRVVPLSTNDKNKEVYISQEGISFLPKGKDNPRTQEVQQT